MLFEIKLHRSGIRFVPAKEANPNLFLKLYQTTASVSGLPERISLSKKEVSYLRKLNSGGLRDPKVEAGIKEKIKEGLEKIKKLAKQGLAAGIIALMGATMFASPDAFAKDQSGAKREAGKYAQQLEQVAEDAGLDDVKVKAQTKKIGDGFVLEITLTDGDTGDESVIKVTDIGNAHKEVKISKKKGSDNEMDWDFEGFSDELFETWQEKVLK